MLPLVTITPEVSVRDSCVLLCLGLACMATPVAAQDTGSRPLAPPVQAGGEIEAYLRVLQTAGIVPLHPWSLRAFSPREVAGLAPVGHHPWSGRTPDDGPEPRVRLVPAQLDLRYNSAFPYGSNDGPVWAGRGATVSASAGVTLRAGPVTAQVAPAAFWSENRGFPLRTTHRRASVYANPRSPRFIDLPQRFGDSAYARLDPGESYLRIDAHRVAVGISSAVQWWGPAERQPLILGAEGPGLPHLFVGSGAPVNVGIGRLHGRVLWGEAGQSRFSMVREGHGSRRFVSAVAATFTPRFAPGLEVGGARFYHLAWPETGLGVREFAKLLDPFTKSSLPDVDGGGSRAQPDNQLLSVFARWVLPGTGVEVWGEYGREDHSWDLLDFYLEPDQQAAYVLGVRKVWGNGAGPMWAARGEVVNSQVSHLSELRDQHPFHRHAGTPQGHTHRGQPLGGASVHGGGGWVVGVDRYSSWGRASLEWRFARVDQRWTYDVDGISARRSTDVIHGLEIEGVRFAGAAELVWGVGGAVNLNRHFERDVFNLNARLGLRLTP